MTTLTPAQCRAGRALLGWTPAELASHALCSNLTVRNVEDGRGQSQRSIVTALRAALERAGVEFAPAGEPVRLRRDARGPALPDGRTGPGGR